MIKIGQIIPCLGIKSGGPSRSVYSMTKGLRSIGVDTEILTNNYMENPNMFKETWIHSIDVRDIRMFEYNPSFRDMVKASNYNVFHIHSIYSYPTMIVPWIAREKNIPYIISPRGSLYQNALKQSGFKKKLANKLFLLRDLNKASVIHATCKEEMTEIRKMGIKSPIGIIPNAIEIPSINSNIETPSKKRFGFLGRINPIKNLDGLLMAWADANFGCRNDLELLIIGQANLSEEKQYENLLHQIERERNLTNIVWFGAKYDEEKDRILRSLSYLILPSHSENFGMAALEALCQGVPVIASKGAPWEYLDTFKCGWWIDNSVTSIVSALKRAIEIEEPERKKMGVRGQKLAFDYFSIESNSKKLKSLYEWVLGKGEKPEFVYTV